MVSFWPWKVSHILLGDDSSPASFEKALSTLSNRITKTNTKLDSLRQSSRRFSALWTLYTSFAYLLCSVVLILVVGWREWGVLEYMGVVGGPVLIYLVRTAIQTAYNFRIAKVQAQSDGLQKQRDATIEKLKAATKYNTTQELLQKYGGTPQSKEKSAGGNSQKNTPRKMNSPGAGQLRTGFIPPPTANIPGRNQPNSLPGTPQRPTPNFKNQNAHNGQFSASTAVAPWQESSSPLDPSADFAPNAFSAAPQYAQPGQGPKWYDRLMDVVLGEDETLPRNRLALICHQCRLVNGQAPPGVQRLEAVGKWRCAGCNTMNGHENEGVKLLKEIKEQAAAPEKGTEVADLGVTTIESDASKENADEEDTGDEQRYHDSQDTPSSESEEEEQRPSGETTGAHGKADTTRRRSSRVKKKPKG
ncbi:MAG: hypothetical protein Q9186_007545 [Xanthomendoza sp. 1 TL-2023]